LFSVVRNSSRNLELNGLGPFIGSWQALRFADVGAEGGYNGEEEESQESQEVEANSASDRGLKGLAEAGPFVFNSREAQWLSHRLAELLRYRLGSWMGITQEHPRITVTADCCDLWYTQTSLKKPANGLVSKVMKS
jgi:hypothetical protein